MTREPDDATDAETDARWRGMRNGFDGIVSSGRRVMDAERPGEGFVRGCRGWDSDSPPVGGERPGRAFLHLPASAIDAGAGRSVENEEKFPWNQNSIAAHAYEVELLAGQQPPPWGLEGSGSFKVFRSDRVAAPLVSYTQRSIPLTAKMQKVD